MFHSENTSVTSENCSGCLGATVTHTCGKHPDADIMLGMLKSAIPDAPKTHEDAPECEKPEEKA